MVTCFYAESLFGFRCKASELRYLDRFVCRFPELCPAFRYFNEGSVKIQLEFNFE